MKKSIGGESATSDDICPAVFDVAQPWRGVDQKQSTAFKETDRQTDSSHC